jgi:hypothetical protein
LSILNKYQFYYYEHSVIVKAMLPQR